MSRYYTTIKFISHVMHSRRWDAFHSPFLFELFTYCCDERNVDPLFGFIENQRLQMLQSEMVIPKKDYGAGSVFQQRKTHQSIASIARHALSRPFQCRFLYRLTHFLQPLRILEFGTSLGISTSYLAIGSQHTRIETLEGDPQIAARAKQLFESLGLNNIHCHTTTFEDYISGYMPGQDPVDLLFLDGHHTAQAIKSYYHAMKMHMHEQSVVVVDDIHWSSDMHSGWNDLINLPEVTQSVDCFHFGLLFFKRGFLNKENHRIHLPWRMIIRKK